MTPNAGAIGAVSHGHRGAGSRVQPTQLVSLGADGAAMLHPGGSTTRAPSYLHRHHTMPVRLTLDLTDPAGGTAVVVNATTQAKQPALPPQSEAEIRRS